jgi:NSS family neurotransmitter:Na+ symporter
MHEIGTAFFTEEYHLNRRHAAWIITVVASVLCLFCSWSVGTYDIQVMGLSLMDFCDQLTANFMLPLGGLLACLFVGWYVPRQLVYNEFTNGGQCNKWFFQIFLFAVRYVCPICILLIFLHQLGIL